MSERTPTLEVKPARPKRPRRWLPYVGALGLAALIAAGLWPRSVPVETAAASLGLLRSTVSEEGKTRIKQRYVISAPVTGQLRRIEWKPGAPVKAGETLLAMIEPLRPSLLDPRSRSLLEARRDAAAAQLQKASATRQFVLSELRRAENLFAEKAISRQELETAQWRDEAAGKDETAAESALRQAEAELAEYQAAETGAAPVGKATEIIAPVNGQVLRVFEESSRSVPAGTPLLEVGDPTDIEVVIEALSRDGAVIGPGAKVELEQWGEARILEARVRLIEPAAFTKISALGVEEQRVNVVADLVDPPDKRPGLGDNFRVEARIVLWEADGVLKVPSGALFRRGGQWAAFVVNNGKAELRMLQGGRASDHETQILEGLKAGEEVILYPGDRIRPGLRVRKVTF